MILLKSPHEIEIMRTANVIVAEVLVELRQLVAAGVSTQDLDRIAEERTRSRGAIPAFKGYQVNGRVFPKSVCCSINDEIVHGIPSSQRILKDGDLIGLDFGVCFKGYYGDSAVTVCVGGNPDVESQRLMTAAEESLWCGIEQVRAGNRLGDVSAAIQERVERDGFSVVREFVGHGIGKRLHEDPQVPNYGQRDRGVRLRTGMVLALEPMVNAGRAEVVVKEDGWTAVTKDGSRSAHFEHSVAITDEGPYVLSRI
jgi:methionyl aminopeptidase